jgi:hypothetical protein
MATTRTSITFHGTAANDFLQALIREQEKVSVYDQIREQLELALIYLEDGALVTAQQILRDLLGKGEKNHE